MDLDPVYYIFLFYFSSVHLKKKKKIESGLWASLGVLKPFPIRIASPQLELGVTTTNLELSRVVRLFFFFFFWRHYCHGLDFK
jgi:hypothetical protein